MVPLLTRLTNTKKILVATDVAARGIDVTRGGGVSHVVNLSVGVSLDAYVHRVGRCGRAGRQGMAHSFFLVPGRDEALAAPLVALLGETRQLVSPALQSLAMKQAPTKLSAHHLTTTTNRGREGAGGGGDGGGGMMMQRRRPQSLIGTSTDTRTRTGTAFEEDEEDATLFTRIKNREKQLQRHRQQKKKQHSQQRRHRR
uniref:Helicase C-terminal domain-containing protein n=1 Tax=Octactis speculum TaxID=3111310 RepID=A0A7S2FWM9_9STRA|mmetsp:Transcript_33223/g.44957  ORF Transcript_33223/g.44957 Transcript_33223/m.44957 type:complete len:199 (+) Transcript_33223:119-715(+)